MDRGLIDEIYSALLSDLRELDKSESWEIFIATIIGGALGYFAFSGLLGAALCAFFAWQIRSIPYSIKRQRIEWELRRHAMEHPDEFEASQVRDKLQAAVEKAARRFSFW